MGATVWVAGIGVISTLITTLGVIAVAIINNRKERSFSAEQGALKSMEERLLGRDERIKNLEEDIKRSDVLLGEKDAVITELRQDNAALRREVRGLMELRDRGRND